MVAPWSHSPGVHVIFLHIGLDSMAKRIQQLAQPKPNRLRFPDRRSVYWLDKLPPEKSGSITKIDLTPRWQELSRSKKISTQVILDPEWKVSEWALKAVPSLHLCRLAVPRLPAADWRPERPLLAPLSRATQTAVATARICRLAEPRKKLQEAFSSSTKPAAVSSGSSRSSAHIELLASESAQKAKPSPRLQELSTPREKKALYEGFNPYIISRAARSACPSPRVRQLSLPLPRKCSSQ
uniref:Uncharacterized protein n=1 Tax=Knipowitschia caucasica TaxID=637954 RepID=A0AAV2JGK2_KNICA